jgi:hypothetical protein
LVGRATRDARLPRRRSPSGGVDLIDHVEGFWRRQSVDARTFDSLVRVPEQVMQVRDLVVVLGEVVVPQDVKVV